MAIQRQSQYHEKKIRDFFTEFEQSLALKNNVLRSVAKKHFLKTLALAIAKFILSHFADKICKVLSGLHS